MKQIIRMIHDGLFSYCLFSSFLPPGLGLPDAALQYVAGLDPLAAADIGRAPVPTPHASD